MQILLTRSDLERIAVIVREETGNQVMEKNFSMLENRMKTHLLHLGMSSMVDYWSFFADNELQERELIQSLMTTHHTFFFREYVHFEILEKWIHSNLETLKAKWQKDKKPVRIWSAASSRGQEAYSIAMFLEKELYKAHGIDYRIVGTDIDKESVAYAKNGVYPLREVNGIPKQFLGNLWKMGTGTVKEFAAVGPALRQKVSFEWLNLFETNRWAEKDFDVVFCRNVFIYFSEADVKKVALQISDKISRPGLFISGVSEPLRFPEWPMKPLGSNCYCYVDKGISPAAVAAPLSQAQKYRVLIVDDSPTIQTLLKKIFAQDPNCSFAGTAVNGQEALEKLRAETYDIITLDIHMPVMTGIEFLERGYDRKTHPPVIMISSVNRTDLDLATKAVTLGAFDYVEKPAMNNLQRSSGEILTKVKMALRSKKTEEVLPEHSFETTIAQKIVIPDASQCLRLVFAKTESRRQLEEIIRGQANESRSPAMIVCWENGTTQPEIEASALQWTANTIHTLKQDTRILRPNHFYFSDSTTLLKVAPMWKLKSLSVQLLQLIDPQIINALKAEHVQILADETFFRSLGDNSHLRALKMSDITPSTSFPSLSAEFFANLRKAAA